MPSLSDRLRFWKQRQTDPYFMWGHPDEWSEAEWYYYRKEQHGKVDNSERD